MDDMKRDPRVNENTATAQLGRPREMDTSTAPGARMLANPRRVRRA